MNLLKSKSIKGFLISAYSTLICVAAILSPPLFLSVSFSLLVIVALLWYMAIFENSKGGFLFSFCKEMRIE